MPSDYESIADEHRRGYGEYDHHLEGYEDFYPDDTHFIYELIQNAQDALSIDPEKAGKQRLLKLLLREDELLAWNDGKPFSEENVRAICSIRQSEKNLVQIGTHGIGFKAVGKFTDAPEIYSGGERFRIRRRVEPQAIEIVPDEVVRLVADGCTVFRLPFKASLRTEDVDRLGERLRHVHKWALLFLHDLRSVEWADERGQGGARGVYLSDREDVSTLAGAQRVTLQSAVNGDERPAERFLCFKRERTPPESVIADLLHQARDEREREKITQSRAYPQPIEIAFRLGDEGYVTPLAGENSVLFSFLPTRKETYLRFLVQAHFQTTFARDDIRDLDTSAWNRWLLQEAAAFLPEILLSLKGANNLTPAVFRALPVPREDVPDQEERPRLLRPLLASTIAALKEHALIPTESGGGFGYGHAAEVFHPHSQPLRRLLSPTELAEVTNTERAAWTHPDLRWDQDEGELLRAAKVRQVTSALVVEWLSTKDAAWFEAKEDAWIADLYRYLAIAPSPAERERLKSQPLARQENGGHVIADTTWVFFPPTSEEEARLLAPLLSRLPQFKGSLLSSSNTEAGNETVRIFLKAIGVEPLDLLRLLKDWFLPEYQQDHGFSVEVNRSHVRLLVQVLGLLSDQDRAEFTRTGAAIPFLLCHQGGEGGRTLTYKSPQEAYLSSAYTGSHDLETYFGAAASVWFVDAGYPPDAAGDDERALWLHGLTLLGAASYPRRRAIDISEKRKARLRGSGGCTYDIAVQNYDLDGLDAALDRIGAGGEVARATSLALWRLLARSVPMLPRNQNWFLQGTYRWFYRTKNEAPFFASFDTLLRNTAWVVSDQGNFRKPEDLFVPDGETRRVLGERAEFLHPELGVKEEQRGTPERNLADCLTVRLGLDVPTALEHLKHLSDSAPNVRAVEAVYAFLQSRGMQNQEHRDQFAAHRLIFTPSPEPRWWTAGQAFWRNEISVFSTTRGYLEEHYPTTLKGFFSAVGVSESASFPDYARAVLALAGEDPAHPALQARAHALYERLWMTERADAAAAPPASGRGAPSVELGREAERRDLWRQLRAARCWLGRVDEEGWGWHERGALFRNDHDHNAALFREDLPFWAWPDLDGLARFLEIIAASQTQIDFHPSDDQEAEPEWSRKTCDLAEHIIDFVASPSLVGQDFVGPSLGFLTALRVVLVLDADVAYTLGGTTIHENNSLTSRLELYADGTEATLWITTDAHKDEYPHLIGDALAEHLGTLQLGSFVSQLLGAQDQARVLARWRKKGLRWCVPPASAPSATDADAPPSNEEDVGATAGDTPAARSDVPATQDAGSHGQAGTGPSHPPEAAAPTGAAEADRGAPAGAAGPQAGPTRPSSPGAGSVPSGGRSENPLPGPAPSESTGGGERIGSGASSHQHASGDGNLLGGLGSVSGGGTGGGGYGNGGGPESETHKALKRLFRDKPELAGAGLRFVQEEYSIAAGQASSEVDVLLRDADGRPVCIECKPRINPNEYTVVWQAVRYKHLLAVENDLGCDEVRVVLVAPVIPAEIKAKCGAMGVEYLEMAPE